MLFRSGGSPPPCTPRARAWTSAGKKKLAYQIKREDFVIYVCFDVKLPSDAPLKISNILNITDEVLRYLLVKVDEKTRKALSEQKEQAEKAAAEEVLDKD